MKKFIFYIYAVIVVGIGLVCHIGQPFFNELSRQNSFHTTLSIIFFSLAIIEPLFAVPSLLKIQEREKGWATPIFVGTFFLVLGLFHYYKSICT